MTISKQTYEQIDNYLLWLKDQGQIYLRKPLEEKQPTTKLKAYGNKKALFVFVCETINKEEFAAYRTLLQLLGLNPKKDAVLACLSCNKDKEHFTYFAEASPRLAVISLGRQDLGHSVTTFLEEKNIPLLGLASLKSILEHKEKKAIFWNSLVRFFQKIFVASEGKAEEPS
jgi:hypothetical protein